MLKVFIDTETTGLDPKKHGIIAMSYIIEDKECKILEKDLITLNTFEYRTKYSPKALEVNGYTVEQIQSFQSPKKALDIFDKALCKHSKGERYIIVAYNAKFDKDMLEALYEHVYPGRYWKILSHKVIDTMQTVMFFSDTGLLEVEKHNLETVAKHLDLVHIPHNCVSDNEVQRTIYKGLCDTIKDANIKIQ